MTRISVVMPAHNEASVIAVALESLFDLPADALDVIVVANGCTDATAQRARDAGRGVRVVEVPQASKIAALNAGSDQVSSYPVAFVDADVSVAGSDLVRLAERLAESGAGVGSPTMRVEPSRSWWVRQYYRVWALTDYRVAGHIGSGVYMLSESGRARFDRFPDVIADDLFVQRLFDPQERCTPDDIRFSVAAPGTLAALVRRNSRIAAGNAQLRALYPDLAAPAASVGARSLARRVARNPGLWVGFGVYAATYAVTRLRARRMMARARPIAWSRDETTRVARP